MPTENASGRNLDVRRRAEHRSYRRRRTRALALEVETNRIQEQDSADALDSGLALLGSPAASRAGGAGGAPGWMAFRIDGRILAFGLLVTLAASLGFGIVPAREVLRSNLSESIRQGGRGGTARSAGLRRALITLEVGLALVLVAGAFQLLSGPLRLGRVDPGLTPEKLVVFYVSPPGDKYRRTERLPAYADLYRRVIDRIREVPGVAGVAGANRDERADCQWFRKLNS